MKNWLANKIQEPWRTVSKMAWGHYPKDDLDEDIDSSSGVEPGANSPWYIVLDEFTSMLTDCHDALAINVVASMMFVQKRWRITHEMHLVSRLGSWYQPGTYTDLTLTTITEPPWPFAVPNVGWRWRGEKMWSGTIIAIISSRKTKQSNSNEVRWHQYPSEYWRRERSGIVDRGAKEENRNVKRVKRKDKKEDLGPVA